MGIPNKPVTVRWSETRRRQKMAETFRLDEEHTDLIRLAGTVFDPPSDNQSFNLRTLLADMRKFLITRNMPRWMMALQEKLTPSDSVSECVRNTDSPTPEMAGQIGLSGVAGDAGRASAIRSAKRPPRRFVRPTDRAVGAVAVQVDAWPAPFYGHGPFAYLSQGV